jgi:hypothetical protein
VTDNLRKNSGDEVKSAKYFSVIVDSTSNISHVDKLTAILRYVKPDGEIIKLFLRIWNITRLNI